MVNLWVLFGGIVVVIIVMLVGVGFMWIGLEWGLCLVFVVFVVGMGLVLVLF